MWSRMWASASWPLVRWRAKRQCPYILEIANAKIILGSYGRQVGQVSAVVPDDEDAFFDALADGTECSKLNYSTIESEQHVYACWQGVGFFAFWGKWLSVRLHIMGQADPTPEQVQQMINLVNQPRRMRESIETQVWEYWRSNDLSDDQEELSTRGPRYLRRLLASPAVVLASEEEEVNLVMLPRGLGSYCVEVTLKDWNVVGIRTLDW